MVRLLLISHMIFVLFVSAFLLLSFVFTVVLASCFETLERILTRKLQPLTQSASDIVC